MGERRRRDIQHKRDALGDPIGVNDLKNPQESKDYDYEMKAESSVIDVNRQIQQINTTLPPVDESSDIDVSEEQMTVVARTTAPAGSVGKFIAYRMPEGGA